jgi:hypothetical protein
MRTITKEQFRRGDFSLTETNVPLPYELVGLSVDGGSYILYIPEKWQKQLTEADMENAKTYIRNSQDVCSLDTETVKFLND